MREYRELQNILFGDGQPRCNQTTSCTQDAFRRKGPFGFQHFVQFFFSRELNFGHVEFDMPVG